MMNRMRDRVHEFAANCRSDQRCSVEFVVYLASDIDWAIEKSRWDGFTNAQDSMCFSKREHAIVLDPGVSLAMIVIDLASVEA